MGVTRKNTLAKDYLIAETLCLCRVSSDKQAKNETIISQKQSCLELAKDHSVKIDRFYDEDGVSAWKGDRPMLEEIANRIQKNFSKEKRTRFIAFDLSRLSRDVYNYSVLEKTLIKCKTEILLVKGEFEHTARGRYNAYTEIVNAQRYSDELSEKVIESKKSLAQLGHYTNNPPIGLKRARDEHNKVILIWDEPRANLILQAFEKFASGELPTKRSVAEFLRSHPVWGKRTITETTIKNIFENEVYTGEFSYERYDIPRQKWKIDQLIPHHLFNRVQNRMKCEKRNDYKSNTLEQFPLRNEVCCESCGMPLTAQNTKGRNGYHPHYFCFRNSCELKGKSIRRADIEAAFESRIKSMKAAPGVLDLFVAVMKRNGLIKDENNTVIRKRLLAQVFETDTQIETFGKLIVKYMQQNNESMVGIYEQQIQSATENKQKLQNELNAIPDALIGMQKFQTALERGRDFFRNPYLLWKNGTLSQQRRLIHAVFKDKPRYYRENGFQTAATPWIFNKNTALANGESILVGVAGFEPAQA